MTNPTKNNGLVKAYNIVMGDDDSATVDMYGEVVATRPTDFWTGKPVTGNYIMLDEFLSDLAQLQNKKNVTVHINSVGGDFYAGLAIYNRLRTLNAQITTINDSLAASAGSIIFMAGEKRKAHAGSNLMVHGVMGFMYGYYNVADLQSEIKTLKAHDKALVAAYMEATGLSEETVRAAMSKDTYLTGQEAVDQGWADEVITDEGEGAGIVNMKLSPGGAYLVSRGHAVAACCFHKLPENIPQMTAEEWAALSAPVEEPPENSMQPAPQAGINTNPNGGNDVEIKNVEEMRNAFPEFVAQVETAARDEGAKAERERIQGIEEIQAAIGNPEMVKAAKYGEKPMTAQEVAFEAMKAQASIGINMLGNLEEDAKNSGAAGVEPTPAPVEEPKAQTDDEKAEALLVGAIPANMKKEGK